jgi:hypothetical protein
MSSNSIFDQYIWEGPCFGPNSLLRNLFDEKYLKTTNSISNFFSLGIIIRG